MGNIVLIRDNDRKLFEKKICKIPTEKIIGEPKFSRCVNGTMVYMALVKMSPSEIELINA